jgi:hypothetical protein
MDAPKKPWIERAEDAANFLTRTDVQIATLKQKHERDKRKAKRLWSAIYLRVTGTVDERKAQAETHAEYNTAVAAEMTSLLEYEKLRNHRDTAETVIEFWRSYNKALRDGEV